MNQGQRSPFYFESLDPNPWLNVDFEFECTYLSVPLALVFVDNQTQAAVMKVAWSSQENVLDGLESHYGY